LNLLLQTGGFKKKQYYYASTDLSKIKTYKKNIDNPIPFLYDPRNPEKFIMGKDRNFNSFSLIFTMLAGRVFLTIRIYGIMGLIDVEF
jgi:hypothetical protein